MKKFHNLIRIFLCVVISGCAKAPEQRIMYLADQSCKSITLVANKSKIINSNNTSIKIHKVIDNREHQDNIGIFSGSEIIINDLSKWINNYFAVLENSPTSTAPNEHKILLDIYIKKVYLQNISTSKAATIVLKINYLKNNNIALSKTYRKQLTEVNWSAKDSEIVTLLNSVFRNLMEDIISDLNTLLA